MITDSRTTFALGTALNTGGAASYLLGDVIDIGDLRDLGEGNPIYLVISVETTATSGGSATAAFSLCSDAQAAIAVDGSQTVHATSRVFPVADLAAGTTVFQIALPMEGPAYERYVGIVQTTGTAAFTAGAVNAFLTQTPQNWKAYANEESFV